MAHGDSNKTRGEVVKLTMRKPPTGIRAAPIETIAGSLAGVAVDLVESRLEKEAEAYERQYVANAYYFDFWQLAWLDEPSSDERADADDKTEADDKTGKDKTTDKQEKRRQYKSKPTYNGFVVQRYTADLPESNGTAAMEFECSLTAASNQRLFLIVPERFILREAKAKIVNEDGCVDIRIDVSLEAMWIDKDQTLRQERIASTTFDIDNYDLNTKQELKSFGRDLVGWFPGVPVSLNADGTPSWVAALESQSGGSLLDGAFRLSVRVTERDASRAKEYVERAVKFVGSQRDTVVESAKGAVK